MKPMSCLDGTPNRSVTRPVARLRLASRLLKSVAVCVFLKPMIHWTSLIRLLALMTVAAAGRAAEYDIGPGQPLSRIGQVAMHDLQAGDTVRIHWRAEPYREKFRISGEGTAAQPIRVVGVPGPNGERPVIDGENATTHPGTSGPSLSRAAWSNPSATSDW
jgi:hypothetical protein